MAASYRAEAATLTVSRLASTLMACTDPKLALLDDAVAMRLEGALPLMVQANRRG
jgi:heat shock protein HslJ